MPWTQRKQLQHCQVARGHLVDFHLSWQGMRFAQDVAGSPHGEYTKGPNFRFHATMELGRLHGALKPWYKLKYSKLIWTSIPGTLRKLEEQKPEKFGDPTPARHGRGFGLDFMTLSISRNALGSTPSRSAQGWSSISNGFRCRREMEEIMGNPMKSHGILWLGYHGWENTVLVVEKRDEYETIWLKHDQSLN
jgi:hypothetical protein